MNGLLATYSAALVLGATHALEVDHMVAVNAFLGNRPRLAPAIGFGVRWAAGHAAVVLAVGALLAVTGLSIPASLVGWAELGVGMTLVALGAWAVWAGRRLHHHAPSEHEGHAHLHAHPEGAHPHGHRRVDPFRRHGHVATLVGAVHGLAGTAPIVALVPVTLVEGFWGAVAYLVVFGIGTMLAMSVYTALAALAVSRAESSLLAARSIAIVTAGTSIAVGCWWIVRSLRWT